MNKPDPPYKALLKELEAIKQENNFLKISYTHDVSRQSNAELQRDRQLFFTHALNRIADVIIANNSSSEILENTNCILGETLQVDRMVIFDVSIEKNTLTGLCEWLKSDHPEIAVTKGKYPLDLFLNCVNKIQKTESFLESHFNAVNENFNDERLVNLLHEKLKIKSLLWYPFAFDEHGFYIFALNQILEPRIWNQEDMGFIESAAKQVNLALMKIRLRESEEKYRLLIECANEAIVVVQNGLLILSNPITRKMTGYSEKEIAVTPFTEFVHPEDRAMIENNHQRRLLGEDIPNHYIFRLMSKDGTTRWVQMNAVLITWEGFPATLNFFTDITKLKLVEGDLQKSNVKWEAIISASPDGIGMISLDGKVQFLSDNLLKMYGYSSKDRTDLYGKPAIDFIDPIDQERLLENLNKLLSTASDLKVREYRAVKKDNSTFYVEINYTVLYDSFGNPTNVLFVERDTTERRLAEEAIKESNKKLEALNVEKDKLFSIIAHDLRSPFQGLIGLTELVASIDHDLSNEQISEFNIAIHDSVTNLYTLIENLLVWAQIQKGSIVFLPREVSLLDIFSQSLVAIRQKAAQKDITIVNNIPLSLQIIADVVMINSVFRNLLFNAIKFSRRGGKVFCSSRELANGYLEIAIADNGVGISEDLNGKLFKLGEKVGTVGTENEPSTGLGLLLCKEFIEKHSGKIWVESEVGKGSTFYFTLQLNK